MRPGKKNNPQKNPSVAWRPRDFFLGVYMDGILDSEWKLIYSVSVQFLDDCSLISQCLNNRNYFSVVCVFNLIQ